ncbi:hypothetical protein BU25DRAFT_409402 [Macroventuria anomochaeta]|uniref:Uncharacterized protein n=1 Tax=Macroventuria anomochaeta TaxID=301207 RepID=A0ACB6S676_9PLEO|nr:uncharacterized protein BU25DRAFT_409402 [Macroventuria anomochaeta]KAF2628904.1 hypothetical protein BU25DRAFT_409402 [Macroventuria anomochaeta]
MAQQRREYVFLVAPPSLLSLFLHVSLTYFHPTSTVNMDQADIKKGGIDITPPSFSTSDQADSQATVVPPTSLLTCLRVATTQRDAPSHVKSIPQNVYSPIGPPHVATASTPFVLLERYPLEIMATCVGVDFDKLNKHLGQMSLIQQLLCCLHRSTITYISSRSW